MKSLLLGACAGGRISSVARSRAVWFAFATAVAFGAISSTPGADPRSLAPGLAGVEAAASPNPLWGAARQTLALSSLKAAAKTGTPAASGPSANIGQTIQLKGAGLAPGVASFTGYNGTSVAAPLTNVKVGKKGKAIVPLLAVTGDMAILPDAGAPSNALRIQIVPTITSLSTKQVSVGMTLVVNGTGLAPDARILFPGVAEPLTPTALDSDSAEIVVPEGAQKGKVTIRTAGGTSNGSKVKVVAGALANRALATDPVTGLILATDDVEMTLSAIDPMTGAVLRTYPLDAEPEWVGVAPGTNVAIVGDDEGAFLFFDLGAWAPLEAGPGFDAKRFDARADELHVDANGTVAFADGAPLVAGPSSAELAKVSPDGRRVVVLAGDAGRAFVFDAVDRTMLYVRTFDGPVEGLTFGLDGRAYTMDRETGRLYRLPLH